MPYIGEPITSWNKPNIKQENTMTEKEMITQLLSIFPNMSLGEDNSGQLLVYTDKILHNGFVFDYKEEEK